YYRLKVNDGNTYYSTFKNQDYGFGGLWVGWSLQQYNEVKAKMGKTSLTANELELSNIIDAMNGSEVEEKIIFIWDRETNQITFWKIIGTSPIEVSKASI